MTDKRPDIPTAALPSLTSLRHPDWCKNAVIYEINVRQFSPSGSFVGVIPALPRLKLLGVDIIWLMPIHPIGEVNRKGTLGSPYAVKDYLAINPEFGNGADLRALVEAIHAQGMYVILDWVANHTAWDNVLVEQHPDWYARDPQGNFTPTPWWDWSDIIDLDYSQPQLWRFMADAMGYWVRQFDIDGFRCDVAGFVPLEFWQQVRAELELTKPVFMLAEWESRDLHYQAFDMSYAWSWNELMHDLTQGRVGIGKLFKYYSWNEKAFPNDAIRMTFVSNHDKNAWDGTQFEQFGNGLEAAIVLSVLGEGMPLIYNGQEAGNQKRLAFFERDPIDWQPHPIGNLYQKLIHLKKTCPALANGAWGARMLALENSEPARLFSFVRQKEDWAVVVLINISDIPLTATLQGTLHLGRYYEFFSGEEEELRTDTTFSLDGWGYQVFTSYLP